MKFKLIGIALLVSAVTSQALTLGRVRGAALIGRGLDVVVPIQLDAGESLAPGCVEADVFHGDARQDGSRVRVSVDPAAAGSGSVNLHVVSSALVDEPVVSVYVRLVCGQQTSRRYVMLADVVTEGAAPVAAAVPLPMVDTPVAVSALPGGGVSRPSTATVVGGSGDAASSAVSATAAPTRAPAAARPRATAPVQRAKRPVARPAPASPATAHATAVADPARSATSVPAAAAVAERLQAGRNAGQSRLQLDQMEVLAGRVATLESTTASQPAEAAARDARESERVAAMETNIQRLLTLAAKNEANLQDMRARLEESESQRYANPLVYGLLAILLVLLAACVLLLRRGSQASAGAQSGNWWSHGSQAADTAVAAGGGTGPASASGLQALSEPVPLSVPGVLSGGDGAAATLRNGPRTAAAPITQVDVSLVEMSESTFDRLMQSGTSHSAVRSTRGEAEQHAVLPSTTVRQRSINSEELFDIRQQAEFFVSLGQTDQAVRILENRISQNGESSPLAYLDLLKIFHSLGLRADFRQLRDDFSQLFHASVPEFASFQDEGRDLEEYPQVVAHIEEEWGMPGVFGAIEEHLFRGQWNAGSEPFDLAAFRDLLLLHAVAQWAQSPSESLPAPLVPSLPASAVAGRQGSAASAFGALSTTGLEQDSQQPEDRDAPLPTITGSADLDIDLSDIVGDAARGGGHSVIDPMEPSEPTIALNRPVVGEKNNLIDFDLSGMESKNFKNPKDPA